VSVDPWCQQQNVYNRWCSQESYICILSDTLITSFQLILFHLACDKLNLFLVADGQMPITKFHLAELRKTQHFDDFFQLAVQIAALFPNAKRYEISRNILLQMQPTTTATTTASTAGECIANSDLGLVCVDDVIEYNRLKERSSFRRRPSGV